MTRPIKKAGFYQGIYEVSVHQKESLGTLRITQDGRKFRYARAGAALDAGKMAVSAQAVSANYVNQTLTVGVAVGESSLLFVAGGSVTLAENFFSGGYFHVNDGVGEGHQYEIEGNAAVNADTDVFITLRDPVRVALTTGSDCTLVHSPWNQVQESTVEENLPAGIAPVAVPSAYYYWAQTGGPAVALVSGTPAVGSMMTLSATSGALAAINATLDIDQPVCAIMKYTAGVAGEYKPVFLTLD